MFLNNPHGVSGHYGTVARKVKDEILKESDKLEPYFVSAFLYYRVESFFRKNRDYKDFTRMKWHILMTIKYMLAKNNKFSPNLNSKDIRVLSTDIERKLATEASTNRLIREAIQIIKEMISVEKLDIEDRKIFERKETTDKLKKFLVMRKKEKENVSLF
jgi:hypothetical protein